MLVRKHFLETKALLREVEPAIIASWLLNDGFFPEQYVLPPTFKVSNFELRAEPYFPDLTSVKSKFIISVSYPKSALTHRLFGIQHPHHYHDIVYWLMDSWEAIIEHLFDDEIKIYSYSFPIPLSKKDDLDLSPLRSGRMIYEWIEMAERDLIVDAVKYNYLARTDITNFYGSIYTHSISWALHAKDIARKDKSFALLGNKLDKLMQYSNDTKTNGIPVGSALSDLIAEIILASVDKSISRSLNEVEFVGARFKDDYRILCQNEANAKLVIKTISDELMKFNLNINESKTKITKLPDGLYREHSKHYYMHSLSSEKNVSFKKFEMTVLIAMDIHRKFPGTSILDKFLSELFYKNKLKIDFSKESSKRSKELMKVISILLLMKRESEKILSNVLSIIDDVYINYKKQHPELKEYLKEKIQDDIILSSSKDSIFDVLWLMFFSKYLKLGIGDVDLLVNSNVIKENDFYRSLKSGKQYIFNDSRINLFVLPSTLKDKRLIEYVDVFKRD